MIHLKRSNSYYGYKGIQPQHIGACQLINPEIRPEKLQLVIGRVFADLYKQNPVTCCPDCVRIAGLVKTTRISNEDFYKNLCDELGGTLQGLLYQHTSDLFTTYISAQIKYGENRYKLFEEINGMTYDQLIERYPQTYVSPVTKKQSVVLSNVGSKLRKEAGKAIRMGKEAFMNKLIDLAREHYIKSTDKLAQRLQQKGITGQGEMKIRSERIDGAGNISLWVSCDGVTVRAFTIIASGPIQEMHYRYLVK